MNKKTAIAAVAALLVSACEAVCPAYDTLIAHRGESVDAPENTLPAYKTAVERGFGFECDIYLSKDGRVFTFHVWTVDELSDTVEAFRRGVQTVTTNCARKQLDEYNAGGGAKR